MARRRARRRWGPPLAAVAMTAWLVAILGSERVSDRTAEAHRSLRPLLRSLTGLPSWSDDRLPANLEWALAAKLSTLLVAVAVLSWLATAAGSRMTAFLAGWAALVVSSALAGLVFVGAGNLVRPDVSSDELAAAVAEVNGGAVFGLYTGWLVGMAIAAVVVLVPRSVPARSPRSRRRPAVAQLPPSAPIATWPPRPPIGTVLPNPAWTAAGPSPTPGQPEPWPS